MNDDILINVTSFETRIAIIESGIIQELHIERNSQKGKVGNIYIGKVIRVLPGLQSAFIDIGLERSAFIHIMDLQENRRERLNSTNITPIEKLIFPGQTIITQIIKDQIGSKGARLTTQISLAGRILVYLPYEDHLGVSQKINSEEGRMNLKDRLKSIIDAVMGMGGYIIRTNAEDASDEEIQLDIKYLNKLWSSILSCSKNKSAPYILYEDLDISQRIIRDIATPLTKTIRIDSLEVTDKLVEWSKIYAPFIVNKIQYYSEDPPLFDLANIDQEIKKALSRKIELRSGGYIIIDQTEAMTTIDVNTGKFVGGKNLKETIFRTNLEAAQAISRQLRLRNLGGIIILDFIDMEDNNHQDVVLQELQKYLSKDKTKITINGFTKLGLVEITRKRTRDSLKNQMCETCLVCNSQGYIKTAKTICYEILREILQESRQFNPKEFRILASQKIIDLFLEEENPHLTKLSDIIQKTISLAVENSYSSEEYDIILI
ncbi:ribonuclease G [Candidatus Kinetoplastibacterium blastocrithidii TCC012E]|uniref:Ribonuclease G n=1 Tax=Candidatus Kinetoplastidibacterium blastocrithidiae TCC012E TaxID=1208922 RepID=M1MCX7_9PROT|nr:Rne/Rng family ribonuclease [Candidatus Kinetoplastibacterium blastocrithidii]AFZ83884.1 ribonuclease G [Candidatus Kinetoplastibacterium blastocrithidii (ex Strigomonas culicis)]AGF49635.1 ribonuclease G [Candidatus Kinetoplastibacterium blastocrithidii TCC012E]